MHQIEGGAAELLTLADYELAVAALTHPARRADNTLQKQVEGVGMYQAAMRKREQAGSTPQNLTTKAAKRKAAQAKRREAWARGLADALR